MTQLTEQQKRAIYEEMKAQEAQEANRVAQERKDYKQMASNLVSDVFPTLMEMSLSMGAIKQKIVEDFKTVIDIKKELYDVDDEQNSHTLITADSKQRIRVGYTLNDGWDDTVNEGEQKVKNYIASLANTEETKNLVRMVLRLLSKDSKGNLNSKKVLELQQMAEESDNAEFKDGVEIISKSYKPNFSKIYIKAQYKDENNSWIDVPLGMTTA